MVERLHFSPVDTVRSRTTVQLSATHSKVESPTGIQLTVWPIVTDASLSQSRSKYAEYLRTHSTVCQCAFFNADCELGLNAVSNQVTKIVQNSNKTVKLQTSLAYKEQT